jgi:cysteine desulfurase/selenocysteine lyase
MHDFRAAMPLAAEFAYFDHAAVAPLCQPAAAAIERYAHEALHEGDTAWPRWAQAIERLRLVAAQLIGATPAEIALVPNTTFGINLVAEGFPWRSGDNVVVPSNEFPSNLFPWLNLHSRGVEVRQVAPRAGVELSLDDVFSACNARTRMIAISWVGYATGWRIDVDELVAGAHERGTLVFLDAIQGLGVFPIDVARTPVDFLAADGHKWLLGPEGAGVFYLRREHLDLLRPLNVGWHSVPKAADFSAAVWQPKAEAQRYEGGSQNMVGMLGLLGSLELLMAQGLGPQTSTIADAVLALTTNACEELERAGAKVVSRRDSKQHQSGIVAFEMPDQNAGDVRQRLLQAKVITSVRNGWLRIAPHGWNNVDDVARLIAALR